MGVQLNKDIVKVAAKALESNLTRLGPKVLPYAEQLLFAYDFVLRRFGWRTGKPYQPKFRKAFNHFCLHAGKQTSFVQQKYHLHFSKFDSISKKLKVMIDKA